MWLFQYILYLIYVIDCLRYQYLFGGKYALILGFPILQLFLQLFFSLNQNKHNIQSGSSVPTQNVTFYQTE